MKTKFSLFALASNLLSQSKMKIPVILLTFVVLPLAARAADITGTWKSEFDSQIGNQKYTFTFKQDGTKLTGKANSEAGDRKREAELKEGKVEGDAISFVEMLRIQDNDVRIAYTGKLSADGNEIKFTREVGEFGKQEIVARREQSASSAAKVSGSRPENSSPLKMPREMSGSRTRVFRAAKPLKGPTSRLPTRRVRTSTGRNATAWTRSLGRCRMANTW